MMICGSLRWMLRLLQVAGVAFSKLQNADNVGKSPALILKRGFMIAIMNQSSHGSPAAEQATCLQALLCCSATVSFY